MGWTRLCRLDELREGEGTFVEARDFQLAVFLWEGRVHVMDNACPHAGGSMSAGYIEEGCAVCPWHGWAFTLDDGSLREAPAVKIPTFPSRVVLPEGSTPVVEADLPESNAARAGW